MKSNGSTLNMERCEGMRNLRTILILFFLCSFSSQLLAQSIGNYVVQFTDKKNSPFSLNQPEDFLSDKAIARRHNQNIDIYSSDLPISPEYLEKISVIPAVEILSKSKWFNDVVIEISDSSSLDKIAGLDFVSDLQRMPGNKKKSANREVYKSKVEYLLDQDAFSDTYGSSYRQTTMLNADYLHARGYRGETMRIAVIDGGFSFAWMSKHFYHLYQNKQIIDAYNFVDKDDTIYAHSLHGTYVLSTMAAYLPDTMIGTSPQAEYVLLRSEDGAAEYLLEEYFWTEAAEFADSAGCDIINSSLGYTTFDDSLQNHTWQDLDGKTTRITLSADSAASKGMLVFNSAGNSGDKAWQKIGAPADAKNIIAVGAVDSSANLAPFSSRGPSGDGRIKPDLLAMGQNVYVGGIDGSVGKSNGTSFASPILAGAAACLWQANREKTAIEIREALLLSADLYLNPDTNHGYGIPDMILADAILKGNLKKNPPTDYVNYYPNPFEQELFIVLNSKSSEEMHLTLFSLTGEKVYSSTKKIYRGRMNYIHLTQELASLQSGIYILNLHSDSLQKNIKLLKK